MWATKRVLPTPVGPLISSGRRFAPGLLEEVDFVAGGLVIRHFLWLAVHRISLIGFCAM